MILNLLALAAAQAATPATPATPCELADVPALDVVALRVAMLEQLTNGTARPASADETLKAIEVKAAACTADKDPAAGKAAAGVAVARFTADTIAEKLAGDGVDMARVDAAIRDADPAVLDAFLAKKFDAPGVAELGEQVTGVAGAKAAPETRRLLGAYAFSKVRLVRAVKAGPGR